MSVRIQTSGLAIIFLMLGIIFVSVIPLSPLLTITVQIQSRQPFLSATQALYQRIAISSGLAAQRDVPVLTVLAGTGGNFQLEISVSYKDKIITSPYVFPGLGDGMCQVKITYLVNAEEDRSTPYVVRLWLLQNSLVVAETSLLVLPA